MAIQRINYHTGLFLEEAEFKLEQNYHMLMRRRMNHALFTSGVLYGLGLNYKDGKLTILPGMAIDKFTDSNPESPSYGETLSREIMVTGDHDATEKINGLSGTAWITINYREEEKAEDAKAPTGLPTKTTEFFDIEVHQPDSPGEGNEKILLGSIEIGTDSSTDASQMATLRLGGGVQSLLSIAINPVSSTVQVGNTVQLTATGSRSDNSTIDLTGIAIWSSSDDTLAAVDSQGLVTGLAEGVDITITAESEGITGTATVTVAPAVTLESIAVTPDSVEIDEGAQIQLTATGTYSDSSTSDLTSTATWSSSDDILATVDSQGLVTGLAEGVDITITAESEGITGTATVTVAAGVTLVSIAITPDPVEIDEGSQVQLTATGTYSDATTADLTSTVTWNSIDPAIASFVDPINSPGLLEGVAVGSTQINATVNSTTGVLPVLVKAQTIIDFITPQKQASSASIEIHGQYIHDANIVSNQPATGTDARLFKGSDEKLITDKTVRPPIDNRQVVRITVPDRTGTPWGPIEIVTLELTFDGGVATVTFQYDD